jgi:hypothetical protein
MDKLPALGIRPAPLLFVWLVPNLRRHITRLCSLKLNGLNGHRGRGGLSIQRCNSGVHLVHEVHFFRSTASNLKNNGSLIPPGF